MTRAVAHSLVIGAIRLRNGWDSFLVDGLFVALACVAGAIVGSFVNVVVHRVPRGRSVVGGRSACPACGGQIRARDNLPVLGWLLLRGRCRDCNAAISPRYVVVEAACGLLLGALAMTEVVGWYTAGRHPLPLESGGGPGDFRWLAAWGAKALALLTLTAWSLLARAGHAVASRTAALAAVILGVLAAAGGDTLPAGATWAAAGAVAGWVIAAAVGTGGDLRSLPVVGAAGGLVTVVATAGVEAGIRSLRRAASGRFTCFLPPDATCDALAASGAVWIAWPLLRVAATLSWAAAGPLAFSLANPS